MSVELPLKPRYRHPAAKKVKSTSSNAGTTGGKKGRGMKGLGLQVIAQAKKDAQQQTLDNKMTMVISGNGKARFVRAKDLAK